MNKILKITALLAVFAAAVVFVNPVMARRYDTALIAYDRLITEDYRYESWNTQDNYAIESGDITYRQYDAEAKRDVEYSEVGRLEPINAIFGVFNWISEYLGCVFGADVSDPYESNP
ncbi:MAG: hypothetical protein K9M75_09120 [Phycisphaerae bacterium]|nr:hypothetical protein [Phycisphaerae bacterium]